MENDLKSSRPWTEVAEEVCREFDQEKLGRLLEELDLALQQQTGRGARQVESTS